MHKPERRHAAFGYVSQLQPLYGPKLVSEGGSNTPLRIRNGTQLNRLSGSRKVSNRPKAPSHQTRTPAKKPAHRDYQPLVKV